VKLLKIGHPREPYHWVLNWGWANTSLDEGVTYSHWQFAIWIGRARGKTIYLYRGPLRLKAGRKDVQ